MEEKMEVKNGLEFDGNVLGNILHNFFMKNILW